ncbi:MAG: hypothetical protein ACTSRG_03910 [Candidatus Helarchaeota archaeon]
MYTKPDDIKEIILENQTIKLYQFNSKNKFAQTKAKLIGSVGQVIDSHVKLSDLYKISPAWISKDKFGFGAAAKASKDSISNLGEAFGMDQRFFLANPSKVGPKDPFISVKDDVESPFFFFADMNFGMKRPVFRYINSTPVLEGKVESGAIYKFKSQKSIQLSKILEFLIPINLCAIYFKGQAYARDVVDKLLKISPSIINKRPYGKINTPEGLKDFFVMNTVPKGFSGILDIIAFGVAIKFPGNIESPESVPISENILKKLFYFTPGTVKNINYSSHIHGLIFSNDETASILDQEVLNLCELPLSQICSDKEKRIPHSGRVIHIENTTKIISGAFKIAPITHLETI